MNGFNYESLKLQFKLDNEFDLVFVVSCCLLTNVNVEIFQIGKISLFSKSSVASTVSNYNMLTVLVLSCGLIVYEIG